jgi:hypothetical protein
MKARKLLEKAALGPDQFGVLFEAFDGARKVLKPQYGDRPQRIEVGRVRLANAVPRTTATAWVAPTRSRARAADDACLGSPLSVNLSHVAQSQEIKRT